MGFWNLFKE